MVSMERILAIALCAMLFMQVCEAHVDTDADTNASVNLRDRSLIRTKSLSLLLLFVVTFLGSLLPYYGRKHRTFVLLGTQFSGAVILTSALMHFLFDAHQTFKVLLPKTEYSFAAMFAVVGYLLAMLADLWMHRKYDLRAFQQLHRDHDLDSATEGPEKKAAMLKTVTWTVLAALLTILSFHSIFDGITVGVSATKYETVNKMWKVMLHKLDLGIALGILASRVASPRLWLIMFLSGFAFSISTPLGGVIGILSFATDQNAVADWIFAVCMSLGTGVCVYVVINHILAWDNHKFVHQHQALLRWLAVVSGAVVTGIVLIWD